MARVVHFIGYSDSGKTTVMDKVVQAMKARGLRVAAVKHAPHGYEADIPGKDSRRFFDSGADAVVIAGTQSYTMHRRCFSVPGIREIIEAVGAGMDFILVEGFKNEKGLKIEIWRDSASKPLNMENTMATVGDVPGLPGLPHFTPEQTEELTQFIISKIQNEPADFHLPII